LSATRDERICGKPFVIVMNDISAKNESVVMMDNVT